MCEKSDKVKVTLIRMSEHEFLEELLVFMPDFDFRIDFAKFSEILMNHPSFQQLVVTGSRYFLLREV